MDVLELHRRSADRFRMCLDGVTADQWGHPTPCTEWDVRALVDHVVGNHARLAHRLHGEHAAPGIEAGWPAVCSAVHTGLARPDVLTREVPSPFGGRASVADLARVLAVDLTVHTWDLARAVGADDDLDPDVVAAVLPLVEQLHPVLAATGKFGSTVEVPGGADAQRRLLGLLGRRSA